MVAVAAAEVLYARAPRSDTIRVFDMEERTEILALTPYDNRATALSFSPDGKRLLAGYSDSTGEIWDFVVKEAAIETRENM
jgi:WD40 repeat protein